MSEPKIALLVIHTNSYFANLLPVARLLASSGKWQPQFLFASWYPTVGRDQERARALGFVCHGHFTDERPSSRFDIVMNRVRATTAYAIGRLALVIQRVRAMLRVQRVALLILPADNRYDIAAYVKAAHAEGIRAVAVPAFMAAASEWAQFVQGDPAHQVSGVRNQIAAAMYPAWTLTWAGKPLLALPASEVLARQWLGLAPPSPWTLHSGDTDAIAIESEALRRYCLAEGLPSRRLVLTGSIDHDLMHARRATAPALREELYRSLGLPPGKPLIVTALAPDWLYGRGRPECEFTEFRELVRVWLETLSAGGAFNVVVSLHPSVKPETMAWIEEWGAKIARDNVSSLIPLCDLYVACVSATIQWAIACGTPVINYDVYKFHYPDYLAVEGVIHVEDRATYRAVVERFATDESYRADLREKQARHAKQWGILDGNAGARLLGLFGELAR